MANAGDDRRPKALELNDVLQQLSALLGNFHGLWTMFFVASFGLLTVAYNIPHDLPWRDGWGMALRVAMLFGYGVFGWSNGNGLVEVRDQRERLNNYAKNLAARLEDAATLVPIADGLYTPPRRLLIVGYVAFWAIVMVALLVLLFGR